MGQRLNIEIKNKDKVLANSYYHWSAYSQSSLNLAKKIIDGYKDIKEDNEILRAVIMLGLTGAGLTRESIDYAYKNIKDFNLTIDDGEMFGKYLIPLAKGRNEGLIGITEHEMNETRSWEEGRITIDIDSKTFDFDVLSLITDDWWLEDLKKEHKLEKIKEHNIQLKNIPFEDINKLINEIDFIIDKEDGYFKINKDIYSLIY